MNANLPGAFAAILAAAVVGTAIVGALWPRTRSLREDLGLVATLGVPVGLGVTSVTFFAASLLTARAAWLSAAGEILLVAACACPLSRAWAANGILSPQNGYNRSGGERILQWLLVSALVQGLVVAAVVASREYRGEPFGGWDGWAIWNMHARFMLRGGTEWPGLLAPDSLHWTHPDYPRLIPAAVARVWAWAGSESPVASASVGGVFALATLAVLVAAVARLRAPVVALGGGLLLVATPFFVTFAPSQHADIPLGCLMLVTLVLAIVAEATPRATGLWVLTGIAAGLAAWTKNEGLLFAAAIALVAFARHWRSERRPVLAWLVTGLALGLAPVAAFKLLLAPTNDLLAVPLGPRLAQVFDAARHRVMWSAVWRDLRGFGEWAFAPYLAMALPFVAWRTRRILRGGERQIILVIAAMLAGYLAVYLISPHDITWHVNSSLVRLLLQLWPLALLGWCLAVPPFFAPTPGPVPARARWRARVAVIAANALAALVVLLGLSRQLAASELAVRRTLANETRVALGRGWYPVERYEQQAWAWSAGTARLWVRSTEIPAKATLRFALRSVSPRNVTLRTGARVLWEGRVDENDTTIELPDLPFENGLAALEFSTDTAGVAESAEHGGRTLAFAIVNVRLK